MESMTELPEALASMPLLNNINSDFLTNKGQILIDANLAFSTGLKSFHHTDLIDNQIHHILNTTQHDHVTDTYTNKTLRTEDNNNNIQLIVTSDSESDCGVSEDSLYSEDKKEMPKHGNVNGYANGKEFGCRIPNMQNEVKPPFKGATQLDEIRNRVKTLKKKYPSDKSKAATAKFQLSKRLMNKGLNLQQEFQEELLTVLAKKKNTVALCPTVTARTTDEFSQPIQRQRKTVQNKDAALSAEIIEAAQDKSNKDACQVCDKAKVPTSSSLLSYSDMPPHLQFNPYITSGYRPILDAWGCVRSLCYVHNETVNIFTHGLPMIYILLTIPNTLPWHLKDPRSQFLIWSHLAGATCPWMGSILYHMFMNCGSSPLLYKRLLQIDMFGIWISQSFGALPMLFASVHCLSYKTRLLVIASYCLFSIWGLRKALIAATPWRRRICFALPFMMRNLLCILRLTKYGGGAPDSLVPTILQDVLCVIGGVIGAEKVPEKWWPGATDYCFNSHNLMHILALLALYYNNRGSVRDIEWMRSCKACSYL